MCMSEILSTLLQKGKIDPSTEASSPKAKKRAGIFSIAAIKDLPWTISAALLIWSHLLGKIVFKYLSLLTQIPVDLLDMVGINNSGVDPQIHAIVMDCLAKVVDTFLFPNLPAEATAATSSKELPLGTSSRNLNEASSPLDPPGPAVNRAMFSKLCVESSGGGISLFKRVAPVLLDACCLGE